MSPTVVRQGYNLEMFYNNNPHTIQSSRYELTYLRGFVLIKTINLFKLNHQPLITWVIKSANPLLNMTNLYLHLS